MKDMALDLIGLTIFDFAFHFMVMATVDNIHMELRAPLSRGMCWVKKLVLKERRAM